MKTNCEHQCSGRCRREGCNCACGEWHGDTDEQDDIQENTDSMEEKLEALTSDTVVQHSVPNNHPRNFNEIKNFQCPHEVFIYSLINHQGVKMIQCADCGYREPQFNKDGTLKKIKKRQ